MWINNENKQKKVNERKKNESINKCKTKNKRTKKQIKINEKRMKEGKKEWTNKP